jgi:hypothetical protein
MSLPHSQWCNAIAEGSTAAECTCGAVTAADAVLAAEARADEAERLLRQVWETEHQLRRALRAALNVWCPRHPGGDGADGETYELCRDALKGDDVCPECERPKGHIGPCGMEEPGDYPYPPVPGEAPEQCCGCTDDCCCEHDADCRAAVGIDRAVDEAATTAVTLIVGCRAAPDDVKTIETAAEYEELMGNPPDPAWGLK